MSIYGHTGFQVVTQACFFGSAKSLDLLPLHLLATVSGCKVHPNIPMRGDENDGNLQTHRGQSALNIQTIDREYD